MLTEAHAAWAAKQWEKYKKLKREIHDSVQRLWSALVPNNMLPSGTQKLNDIVELLRKKMFDVWKFAKTSAKSKVRYADQEMKGPCADWHPNWWAVWKAMGPASGANCSATFMSECGLKVATSVVALPTLLDNHFQAASNCANFTLHSKKDLQRQRASEAVKQEAMAGLLMTPCKTSDAHNVRSSRVDTKSLLNVRRHEIQRLEFLVRSTLSSAEEKKAYELELFRYMQQPVLASPLSDSSTTVTESSAAMASFIQGAQSRTMQDAASIAFRPIMPPLDVHLDPLLAMPACDISCDDHATFLDQLQVESSVMSESTLLPSCPVDIPATDFANSCFSTPADTDVKISLQPTPVKTKRLEFCVNAVPTDGSCCFVAILESLLFLRRGDDSFLSDRILVSIQALRESLVKFIHTNAHSPCSALGGQSFGDGIKTDYVVHKRELRDSDFIRLAMEATPARDTAQRVSSFWGYCNAMRQPRAYGDEFVIAAAAADYKAQICVFKEQDDGSITQLYYDADDSQFRIYLLSRNDHYEWMHPVCDFPQSTSRRASFVWNPPSLKSDEQENEMRLKVKFSNENGLQFGTETQEEWERSVAGRWHLQKFGHSKDSFFDAFVFWRNLTNPNLFLDVSSLRETVADYIYKHAGSFDDQSEFDDNGYITLECSDVDLGSDRSSRRFSLQQYCEGIADSWPAGDLEIRATSDLHKVNFKILEHEAPLVGVCNFDDPDFSTYPKCRLIRVKASALSSTRLDSYSVLCDPKQLPPFFKYQRMVKNLPVWNIDMQVVWVSLKLGREVQALRTFAENEVLGVYDGHRCDLKGNLIMESPLVTSLFILYPQLNRHVTGQPFKASHAVCLGRNHTSGLVIDGHPLCHPMLDANQDSLGRMALCNSAPSDAEGVCFTFYL